MARFLLCGEGQLENLSTARPGCLPESGWNRNETVWSILGMVYTGDSSKQLTKLQTATRVGLEEHGC